MPCNCRALYKPLMLYVGAAVFVVQALFAVSVMANDPIHSATETDFPPFSIVHNDGRADGFSVELLRAALSAMGRDVTFRTGSWPEVRVLLEVGEIEALPLVGRTPEREALFDFTFPYMSLHGAIVVHADNDDILTVEDLRGRRVAVMKGDNAEEFLLREDRGIDLFTTDTFTEALESLAAGHYDAVVIQRLVAVRLLEETGLDDLRIIGRPIYDFRQDFSFAVKKGDHATLALLNEGLALVIGDGTYQRLHAKWFAALQLPVRQRLIVGGDDNFPPYEYLDAQGNPTGFNTDLIRVIAHEAGLDIEIRLGPWNQVLKQLENGDIDIIQGIFYSPERSQHFDFGTSHLITRYVSAVRQGSLAAPESYAELAGLRLVAQRGDIIVEELYNRGLAEQLTLVDTQEEALLQLLNGHHDCALVARLPALAMIEQNNWTGLQLGRESLLERNYSFAVKKGEQALLAKLNEGLQAIQSSGEYNRIHDEWFARYHQPHSLWSALRYSALILIPLALALVVSFFWSWLLRRQVAHQTRQISDEKLRLQAITDTAQDAIFMMNPQGKVVFVNPAVQQLIGYEPEEVLGQDLDLFIDIKEPTENQSGTSPLADIKTAAPHIVEITTQHKDGHQIHGELSFGKILLGEGVYRVGVIRDITERKQAQELLEQQKKQLEQRNKALKQFNYAVSHELKTPLVTIESSLGMIESTLPTSADPGRAQAFGYARYATRQMNRLLESLLLMFRIDAKDDCADVITWSTLAQEAVERLSNRGRLQDVDTSIATEGPLLTGDRDKFVQLWQHLIGNAAKFMGDQPDPAIEVGVEQSGHETLFYVRDNGIGIEKPYQARIFDLFDQLDKNAEGMGLGLTLVQRIVDYYGGTIRVESAGQGQGSCFYFTLPDALIKEGASR